MAQKTPTLLQQSNSADKKKKKEGEKKEINKTSRSSGPSSAN